jgi:selenide,water dikinase
VLIGFATGDDSGVYRLAPDLAIVQSVDVLTPIVDDPRTFGQIAAANALSDLYVVGAQPRTALNILTLPPGDECRELGREILLGGHDKFVEAGASLIGGHTIEDPELKYGVCVTGTVHPGRMLTHAGARPGDGLVLTKAVGTGVVATAIKGGLASPEHAAAAARSMATLNAAAARLAAEVGAHACTDVTGFGLIGHLLELLRASGVGAVIEARWVPLLPGALDYCGMGMLPGGSARLKLAYGCKVDVVGSVDELLADLLFDAQTSGGLLVAAGDAERFVERLRSEGVAQAAVIGHIVSEPKGRVSVE